jgi:methanogenic corrinoid protein MtbC1
MTLLQQISDALVQGDEELTIKLVKDCLAQNMEINQIIDKGLALGIREVWIERFAEKIHW